MACRFPRRFSVSRRALDGCRREANISRTTGYGSHGTVVLRGEFQGRAVAVKRLLKDFVTIATHEVALLQESDDHPHVIRYFCKEQRDTFLYIALELCPASLFDLVDQPSSFPELVRDLDSKRALKQIASGIRHLHKLKIVHRDIKPQNILVSTSRQGKGVRMLISDFGLCKKLDLDESSFQQTVNHAAGSFGYRAPEVLRGQVDPNEAGTPSHSTNGVHSLTSTSTGSAGATTTDPSMRLTRSIDIFSLGCIFYYVLTGGEHPFGGRYEREMNILQGKISLERLDGLGEEAVEVQDLITRMVASDPRERCACSLRSLARRVADTCLFLAALPPKPSSYIPSSGTLKSASSSSATPATASKSWSAIHQHRRSSRSRSEGWRLLETTGRRPLTGRYWTTSASTANTMGGQ